MAVTVLAFLPASWVGSVLEAKTAGRLSLGDAQGTLWRGSAFFGGAPSERDPVTPLLPGRFSWKLSPLVLLGWVNAELENTSALSQPLKVTGDWSEWEFSAASISLPAERLAGLGAPLNTIQPTGQLRLSWEKIRIGRQGSGIEVNGLLTLELTDIASRLSSVRPLGEYSLAMDWRGQQANVTLKTVNGPMLLSGAGLFVNGRLQFSGRAEAAEGQEEKLANFLNLLGQRRKEGAKNFIALEFK